MTIEPPDVVESSDPLHDETVDEVAPGGGSTGVTDPAGGTGTGGTDADDTGRRVHPAVVVSLIVVAFAIVVGIILRYRYYSGIEPGPDSDEAEMGLLARELLRGEWPLLMRNQPYGGTPWLWAIAPSLRIFGMNTLGLRVPTVLLGLTNAGIVYGIGRALDWSRVRSAATAAAMWCFPMAAVYFASRETLYFLPAITGGLASVLLILLLLRRRTPGVLLGAEQVSRRWLVLAGIAAGVGLWVNPGSLYLTFPAFAWLGVRVLRETWAESMSLVRRGLAVVRPFVFVGIGAVIGAFPWLFLTVFGDSRRNNYEGRVVFSITHRAESFLRLQLPGWFGFRVPYGGNYEGPWLGGVGWKIGFVAFFALVLFQIVRPSRRTGVIANESILTALAIGVPFVYLLVSAQAGPIYANLRYVFFASPIIALLIAAKWRRDLHAALALALLPLIAVVGSFSWHPAQGVTIAKAAELIESRGVTCALGDYWAGGHRLMFESEGRIVTATTYENRNPLYLDEAARRGNCAWLFRDGQTAAVAFEEYMKSQGIGYETFRPDGRVVVYFPDRRIWLDDVPVEVNAGS